MGDRKVNRGDPIIKAPTLNAGFINKLVDIVAWYNRTVASGESGGGAGPYESTSGLVKIKNLTGSDLVRGNYVQLGDYLLTDVHHRHRWFEGNLYDAAEDGRIAIVSKAIKTGDAAFHDARILGACNARVNITDITHRFAAPDDGAFLLVSAASGDIEILSTNKISGTGEQELAVVIGGSGSSGGGNGVWGLAGVISGRALVGSDYVAGEGILNVWEMDDAGVMSDTLVEVQVFNISVHPTNGSGFIQAKRDQTGRLIVDFEDCGGP